MKKQTCDIVFAFPPAYGNAGAFRQHLGVAYLRTALASAGIATEQYCSERPGSISVVARDILNYKPRVVGFTVYDSNYPTALAIARAIKAKRPEVIILLGGPTATFSANEILRRTESVDACVLGEAEEIGPDILCSLLDGSGLVEGTPGLAIRRGNDVISGSLPPLVGSRAPRSDCSLDATPSPYLSGVLLNGRAGVLTGRGCTHHCQYCAFAALGRKTLRLHSVERVLAELDYIAEIQRHQRCHDVVAIHDDTFTLLAPRAKALCRAITERKLGLLLSCITRADSIDDEMLQLLREAGFVSLAFGLESVVPQVLRTIGKVRPPAWPDPDLSAEKEFVEKVRTNVLAAKKYGFNVGVSIILGLPSETPEQAAETLQFVRTLPVDYYMHNFLWLFPGTPLWQSSTAYGLDCTINALGLPVTTKYAYDVSSIKPQPRCSLEHDAKIVRLLALDALFSCSCSSFICPGTAAIVLRGRELTETTAAWACEVLDIGGSLIQILPSLKNNLLPEQLLDDRILLTRELVPARHHIHLLRRNSRSNTEQWIILCAGVDILGSHKPHLLKLSVTNRPQPLLDWLSGKDGHVNFCEITEYLSFPRTITRFLRKAHNSDLLESVRHKPVPPTIKYVGRWLKGSTPCRGLSRLEVDASGCVRCCPYGDPIGVIGDSRTKMLRHVTAAIRIAETRRGCNRCPIEHCPRCPFPGVPDEQYCSIMRSQARVLEFLGVIHICSRLPILLACQQERLGEG